MINRPSEVPPPSAAGWLAGLDRLDEPRFVVLATASDQALAVLADYLYDLRGTLAPTVAALRDHAEVEPIGVVW